MSVYAVIRANCFDNTKTKLKTLVMYVKYNVYVRIMYYEYLVVCSIEYANGNSKTFNQLTTIRFKLDQFNYSSLLGRSDPNIFVESLITIITNLVPSMAKLKLVQFGFFFLCLSKFTNLVCIQLTVSHFSANAFTKNSCCLFILSMTLSVIVSYWTVM